MNIQWKRIFAFGLILIIALSGCNYPGWKESPAYEYPTPGITETGVFILPGGTPEPGQTSIPPTNTSSTPVAKPTAGTTQGTSGNLKRSGPDVVATRLEKSPVIDGSLDDWSTTKNDAGSVVFGAENWSGKNDLSGWFMLGWDDAYLYLGVQVTDDQYVENETGSKLYRGDSLEILFDSDLTGDFYVNTKSPDDFQLGISPGNPEPGQNIEAYLWSPSQVAGERPQVITAATKTETGYQVETAIPWHVFEAKPAAGHIYGFVFSISDNDNPNENVQQTMISNDPKRVLDDPTTWGNLLLANQ